MVGSMVPLRRYVLPVGSPVLLDCDGFLLPVADERWWAEGDVKAPVLLEELVGTSGSFVLLSAGGTGKSTGVCCTSR